MLIFSTLLSAFGKVFLLNYYLFDGIVFFLLKMTNVAKTKPTILI